MEKKKTRLNEKEKILDGKFSDQSVYALESQIKSLNKSIYKQKQLLCFHRDTSQDAQNDVMVMKNRIVEIEAELLCVNSETIVATSNECGRSMYADDVGKMCHAPSE